MRCTLDRLMPLFGGESTHTTLRTAVLRFLLDRQMLACTAGVAVRGLLPLCCGSNPSIPDSSKRCFQREIVGRMRGDPVSFRQRCVKRGRGTIQPAVLSRRFDSEEEFVPFVLFAGRRERLPKKI
jgi:hypothetical protein